MSNLYNFSKIIDVFVSSSKDFQCDMLIIPVDKAFLSKFVANEAEIEFLTAEQNSFSVDMLKNHEFNADCEKKIVFKLAKGNVKSIMFVGLGEVSKIGDKSDICLKMQGIGADLLQCRNSKINKFAITKPFLMEEKITPCVKKSIVTNISYGVMQKSYCFNRYVTDEKRMEKMNPISSLHLVVDDYFVESIQSKIDGMKILTESMFMMRDFVNEPCNILNPESYSDIIKDVFSKFDDTKVSVFGEKELISLGMNAMVGVGLGSQYESRMVTVEYKGNPESDKVDVALVGKGVMFDSGGLSIKPSSGMEDMKGDMAGSAICISSLYSMIKAKVPLNIVASVGLVENAIGPEAQRPSDIVKSMSGKTIEILNTDAEGRLVLADVLYYTKTKFNPEYMFDFATLTGAIVVALASERAGIFSDNAELANLIVSIGDKCGDKCWRMPLDEGYNAAIDSDVADVRNTSTIRGGGSSTAAAFLSRFVDGHKKWVHFDVAGVAGHTDKYGKFYIKSMGTGFGVKLVNALVSNLFGLSCCNQKKCCNNGINESEIKVY